MPVACAHDSLTGSDAVIIIDDPMGGMEPALAVLAGDVDPFDRPLGRGQVGPFRFMEFVGVLDAYTADRVANAVGSAVQNARDVVLDVSRVTFVDSAGLRLVENLHDRAVRAGAQVRLHDPSRSARRVLTILEIDGFDICEPRADHDFALRDERTTRLFELPRGHENPHEFRLTIDVTTALNHPPARSDRLPISVSYTVSGELDSAAASAIPGRPWDGLDEVESVTMDLSGVTAIDSAGLRVIEGVAADVRAGGGRFELRDASPIVSCVLEVLDISFDTGSQTPARGHRSAERH